jgi:hypothetical protein
MKQPGRRTHRTAQGKQIDMDLLRKRNELVPAVGNAKVNARGDELGPGGRIIRKREDIVNDYYKNTNSVPSEVSEKTTRAEEVTAVTQQETASTQKNKSVRKKSPANTQSPSTSEAAEWEENDAGDFVKKGE